MTARDRTILARYRTGESIYTIAPDFHLSAARIYMIVKLYTSADERRAHRVALFRGNEFYKLSPQYAAKMARVNNEGA